MHSILSVEHKIDKSCYDPDGVKNLTAYRFFILSSYCTLQKNRKINKITGKEFNTNLGNVECLRLQIRSCISTIVMLGWKIRARKQKILNIRVQLCYFSPIISFSLLHSFMLFPIPFLREVLFLFSHCFFPRGLIGPIYKIFQLGAV